MKDIKMFYVIKCAINITEQSRTLLNYVLILRYCVSEQNIIGQKLHVCCTTCTYIFHFRVLEQSRLI